MSLSFKYIPLTFLNDVNIIKEHIKNTVILRYLFDKYNEYSTLEELIIGTQYGYNASSLKSGQNKFLRISDITDGKVDWNKVPFCDCNDESKYLLHKHDLLIARTGGTTGKSFLIENPPQKSVFAGYLIRIRANKENRPDFLNLFLNSYVYWSQVVSLNKGEFRPSVNASKLKNLIIPKIDIEIQKEAINISKGISVDGYKELENDIIEVLNDFDKSQEILKICSIQLHNTNLLKQSILQEAIQGKLTADWREQNLNTEPASELLNQIKAEKTQLIKDKKITKEKTLPEISEEVTPFILPDGWVWCRIPQVLALTKDPLRRGPFGSSLKKDMFEPKKSDTTKIYEQQNAIKKDYKLGHYYISTEKHPNLNSFLAGPGDILISCAGTIGETYKLPKEAPLGIINQALLKIRLNNSAILDGFFLMMFKSQLKGQVNSDAKGSAMKNMGSVKYLKNELVFGLPPYKEQKAIVGKVENLMQKCEALDQEIKTSEANAQMLMQAVLKEAFEGKKKEVDALI